MTAADLLDKYVQTHTISEYDIDQIRNDPALRSGLWEYFLVDRNRQFAIDLLTVLIEFRKDPSKEVCMEDLMLGSHLLGLHGQVEDCLLVWKAKNVDFDAYCGVDVQLVVFAGVESTISYLKQLDSEEASAALEYVESCGEAGDLEGLGEYFSPDTIPWWV